MIKEIYQGMSERYRKQLDSTISEVFESLIQGDQIQSQLWERQLDRIHEYSEKVLKNMIEIGLCYDL
jgi:predicted transcriptional regulator YdeE